MTNAVSLSLNFITSTTYTMYPNIGQVYSCCPHCGSMIRIQDWPDHQRQEAQQQAAEQRRQEEEEERRRQNQQERQPRRK